MRSVVRGTVWLPGEPDFDAARRPWNLAVEQPVVAAVEAADADDIAALDVVDAEGRQRHVTVHTDPDLCWAGP